MDPLTVEVSFARDTLVEVKRIGEPWGPPCEWTLKALDAMPGYSAALAARAQKLEVRQRPWTTDGWL